MTWRSERNSSRNTRSTRTRSGSTSPRISWRAIVFGSTTARSGDPKLFSLDRGLHLHLAVLDDLHDLPGLLDGNAALHRHLLPRGAAERGLGLLVGQGLDGDAALHELA